jgi:hypothetical protein
VLSGERMVVRQWARYWWVFLVSGTLWLLIAWVVLRGNQTSIAAVGVLVGVVFLLAGVNEVGMAAWRSPSATKDNRPPPPSAIHRAPLTSAPCPESTICHDPPGPGDRQRSVDGPAVVAGHRGQRRQRPDAALAQGNGVVASNQ